MASERTWQKGSWINDDANPSDVVQLQVKSKQTKKYKKETQIGLLEQ